MFQKCLAIKLYVSGWVIYATAVVTWKFTRLVPLYSSPTWRKHTSDCKMHRAEIHRGEILTKTLSCLNMYFCKLIISCTGKGALFEVGCAWGTCRLHFITNRGKCVTVRVGWTVIQRWSPAVMRDTVLSIGCQGVSLMATTTVWSDWVGADLITLSIVRLALIDIFTLFTWDLKHREYQTRHIIIIVRKEWQGL